MTRKTETLIRLTAATKQALTGLAKESGLSLSETVEKLITSEIAKKSNDHISDSKQSNV